VVFGQQLAKRLIVKRFFPQQGVGPARVAEAIERAGGQAVIIHIDEGTRIDEED
jgi:hypothetical protein